MKKFFKNYFSFTRRESIGIAVLFFIIVSLTVFLILRNNGINIIPIDYTEYEEEIRLFESQLNNKQEELLHNTNSVNTKSKDSLFYFNPNNIDSISWLKLGFSPKQVKSIFNYKRKGGMFYTKQDVAKMYAIDSLSFLRIEPYIIIPQKEKKYFKESKNGKTSEYEYKKTPKLVNLNTADSLQLIELKGIGPVLSSRIINFRNKLGGFINKNQLKDIYGLKPETLENIDAFIFIEQNFTPKKININTATYEMLKEHPYIDYSLAKVIVAYRNQHGKFKKPEDVKKIHLLTEELYSKIAPYITIE
jgi:competence ComEA-like helix-hairpin-helix protein